MPPEAAAVPVTGVSATAQELEPGEAFVAIAGSNVDGHDLAALAAERGAAAIVAEREVPEVAGIPVVLVPSTRRALAPLAARWFESPADRLRMVGITGTVGKTSVLSILESFLLAEGISAGTVGSLGVRVRGEPLGETGYTAPDPIRLHASLARIVAEGCELGAMEVTSHALDQERVAGLLFQLGIFTSLIPLEHADYHGSFREYAAVKQRFFDFLEPCAPLVFNADDLAVRRTVHNSHATPIGCGEDRTAMVRIGETAVTADGTSMVLDIRRPLPRLGHPDLDPLRLPLSLRLLGRSNVSNVAVAAAAALCLGVRPETVRVAAERIPPARRRMEVVHRRGFTVIDDTVGHPESVSRLFEVVRALSPSRVHVVAAVRGERGARVNHEIASAIGVWAHQMPTTAVTVTTSADAAGDRDRTTPEELEAYRKGLRREGIEHRVTESLEDAVTDALERAEEGDLVVLLGAQGMDRGQDVVRDWLGARDAVPAG